MDGEDAVRASSRTSCEGTCHLVDDGASVVSPAPVDAPDPQRGDQPEELRRSLAAMVTGRAKATAARDEIVKSWQRSLEFGLRPDHVLIPPDATFDGDSLLGRAAGPVIDQLVTDIGDEPFALVLTDASGLVMYRRVRDRALAARLDAVLLAPGFVYAEEVAGTNGIGTSLSQRQAALVTGGEHFSDSLTELVCAASPVFDPSSGELLGAVDITSFAPSANALMMPLTRRAARDIEQRLVDASGVADRLLLQRFLQDRKGIREPAVYVGERRLVANSAADHLVAAADEELLRDHARRILATPPPQERDGRPVRLSSGRTFTVSGDVILDGSIPVGVVLRLRPAEAAQADRRDRKSFGWDSLTPTEWSVAEQVATGLTNREAAERLFLSPHTVGFHLRTIYRKLEIGSRVELARLMVEHRS
jgi:sigma-54 dependent transcriptional regulator, acetoin dehydrogenase operon transcriptional activator AcoR